MTLPGVGGLVHGCAHVCELRQLRRIVVASRQALRWPIITLTANTSRLRWILDSKCEHGARPAWHVSKRRPSVALSAYTESVLHTELQTSESLTTERQRGFSHFPSFTQMCELPHRTQCRRHLSEPFQCNAEIKARGQILLLERTQSSSGRRDLSVQLQAARDSSSSGDERQ